MCKACDRDAVCLKMLWFFLKTGMAWLLLNGSVGGALNSMFRVAQLIFVLKIITGSIGILSFCQHALLGVLCRSRLLKTHLLENEANLCWIFF